MSLLTELDEEIDDLKEQVRDLCTYNKTLKEALQNLYDEQNGPPLLRDEASWQAAMDKASKLLGD